MAEIPLTGGNTSQKKTVPRKRWNDIEFNAFLDICVRGTVGGKRSGGSWGHHGWQWVDNEMKSANHIFTKDQMRNKWDTMKLHWKLWKDLKGKETGLGWNPIKGTIDASDEWWKEKIQENASYAPLREKGIGQDVYEKYEMLFMDTVATGEYAYAPSSRLLPNHINEDPIYDNVINLVQNHELEESFGDRVERMMNPNSALGGSPIHNGDDPVNFEDNNRADIQKSMSKQTKKVTFKKKGDKGKKKSSTAEITDVISALKESIEATAEKKIVAWGKMLERPIQYSIEEVMNDVLSLPHIEMGSGIHFFCGDLFRDESNRNLYKTLKNDDVKLKWLEYKYKSENKSDSSG
ncbi:hypothetical protein M5689_022714 [Euphorbia peplus]|nr:hypothetical protein M5689_022714 [Euphorbia peplus]